MIKDRALRYSCFMALRVALKPWRGLRLRFSLVDVSSGQTF